ncbi:hypothetical protein [Herpetosiphon geysericola]|uniref:Uncharacterized protein n=1 Tax=Herpetosiphon geysericola TaxID=70996 RepID=A0A0P6YJU1_9CHLR|nr:hypothetical protein [Herpetosiphon geysericola]KPL89990.1 hypothetical protein SE18_08525 [Herpetosiphon geysericola]
MASLLTLAELRAVVTTGMDNADLQAVIDREEAIMTSRIGAPNDGIASITKIVRGSATNVYLPHRIASVTSVEERDTGAYATVASDLYEVWEDGGRIERLYVRWGARVRVVYVPADDRPKRKAATIELVRGAIERTAMKKESVAHEYSYEAPDWEYERTRIYRTLVFTEA